MTTGRRSYKVSRRPERFGTPPGRIFYPLRVLVARAPSGGEIRFLKWADSAERQLSWYQGCLTADENATFWKAKLRAERPGIDFWNQARAVLLAANWEVCDGQVGTLAD